MYYVYLVRKYKDNGIYIGYSNSLKKRFNEHNRGGRVWELIYYEANKARKDAILREKRLKQYGKALGQLKGRLLHSLVMPRKVRDEKRS